MCLVRPETRPKPPALPLAGKFAVSATFARMAGKADETAGVHFAALTHALVGEPGPSARERVTDASVDRAATWFQAWPFTHLAAALRDCLSRCPGNKLEREKVMDREFGYIHTLAQDYLKHVLQIPQPGSGPSRASRVLQDVAFSVQKEVERSLKPCLDNFDVVSVETARRIFNQVMEKEFEDGVINWGRIVTIFAFEGILIKKLLEERMGPDVDPHQEISYFVAEFIAKNTGEWIRQNGGWENGFVKKFEPRSGWMTFLEVTGKICEMLSLLKQYY
ncbi:Bcl-2-related protein A1 [Pteropus alecto]|uniref:Bcl-2-related protein A1 n=2 Tax=Pteropus alecto TaxID=9402 RepID=L5L3N4_PTEAL|nr:Bcl-2-related protein A1 [Pteropus alecto]